MAKDKEDKKQEKKPTKSAEQIEAEKAAKAAKKAEMAAKAKEAQGGETATEEAPKVKGKKGKGEEAGGPVVFPQGYVPRLRKTYLEKVVPALEKELQYDNVMAVPRINKIVISMGLGKAIAEKPRLEAALKDLTVIAGQKAVVCKAKKSVSNFKLREGMEIGAKVTLRGQRMWEFLDRLITLAIPRVKDFRGLNPKGFDGRGNYSMGLTEQSVFPEVDTAALTFHQGMNITIQISGGNDSNSRALLKALGMPFRVDEVSAKKAG